MRLLYVEDNPRLVEPTTRALQRAGFTVDNFASVREARAAWKLDCYAVIILDLMLSDGHGLDLLREARGWGSTTPVLCLTALDGIDDRIAGLDTGADDYLAKPFSSEELLARLRALLRRPGALLGRELRCANLCLDTRERQARVDDVPLPLSRSEMIILEQLLRRTGKLVARESLGDNLYSLDQEWSDNALEIHIHRLRKKLATSAAQVVLRSVRGLGYLLDEH